MKFKRTIDKLNFKLSLTSIISIIVYLTTGDRHWTLATLLVSYVVIACFVDDIKVKQ